MDIQFANPGVDYMMASVLAFQTGEESEYWSGPLFHFYPELDKRYADALSLPERRAYIDKTLRQVYRRLVDMINEKATAYAARWAQCREQVNVAFSDAFEMDCSKVFNDLRCNISMNPIEPRYLREGRFDIFYRNSPDGVIGGSLHELVHFVWFYVWNREFWDDYREYESPSLKWLLSEMVVEAILSDPRLVEINPYFKRENGGCVYSNFFDMKAGGDLILDRLLEMYRRLPVRQFMRESYEFCLSHEDEIRRHIAEFG